MKTAAKCVNSVLLVMAGTPHSSLGDVQQGITDARFQQARVAEAINLAATGNAKEAAGILREAPTEHLIPFIVAALDHNPRASESPVNSILYRALAEHHAANTELGYQALFSGVSHPEVDAVCIAALVEAPPEKRPEVADRLASLLLADAPTERRTRSVLWNLPRLGRDARGAMNSIEAFFSNTHNDSDFRAMAAEAMLSIGPADRALGHFRDEDIEVLLGPIGKVGGETGGTYNTDAGTRRQIRAIVHKALGHPKKDVRLLAFQVLGVAYGIDLVVGNTSEGYHCHPDFREAVEFLSRSDPDEGLREGALQVLATFDERLKAAIRRRERWLKEHGDGAPQTESKSESP
jgi:hypothetical protein